MMQIYLKQLLKDQMFKNYLNLIYLVIFIIIIVCGCDNGSTTGDNEHHYNSYFSYNDMSLPDTGLPVIVIDTNNIPITSKETYVDGNFLIIDKSNPSNDLQASGSIRGRGNTTWSDAPKKPYRIKFDSKQSLFGLTKAKSWVLLANYFDPTLLMNCVAFEMGRRLNMTFANHSIFVEVILNGKELGNYQLTEQVQVGKGRIDIDKNNGWLVEMDLYYDDDPKFRSTHYQLPCMIKSPELESTSADDPGYAFVKNDINELDDYIYNNNAYVPNPALKNIIDMDSLAKLFLVADTLDHLDGIKNTQNFYLYKDVTGTIHGGPPWNFDQAFGHILG
jgi:hypothetical protein